MKFSEIVEQAKILLKQKGRVSSRVLKREFDLDAEALEDLKFELLHTDRVAREEEEAILVWVGDGETGETAKRVKGETGEGSGLWTSDPGHWTPPHLAERIRAEQAALEARGSSDGERKTITALFADLKGSTALIEGLDPEEARAIIDPALQLMMDAVHRYEGYVAQALGDGIFALFGAPLAHEDHSQRALYAALRMQEEMRRYADTLRAKGYPPLLMRVGINTGEVVLRSIRKDDLHADYVPVGHSTNLAARMEQLANPGTIVASTYTHKLTDGYFAFKDLGPTQIKGVEEPLNIYEVLSVGPLRTRLQVSARRGLTRFVGRQSELEQLNKALDQAKSGQGQIVGTMGEPGLGKSRLFYEFKLLSVSGCLVLEAYSVSHGKATAYLPVIELLKSYFDVKTEDDERKRREKIAGKVVILDRSLEDTLPYLYALLGVEEQPSPLQQMDPQIRRKRTFEALKKLFLRESLNQPLILIFEDLHWIDGETQGFLDVLSESVASAKVLLLVNYRPEYRQEWGQKTYYTQLRLSPLGRVEAEELLTFLLGNDASLTPVKSLILEKTEGTPFFMEEVVQTLAEEGALLGERGDYRLAHAQTALHLPLTVQGILVARIDRLAPDEKALLQQLAVIGREFPVSLLRQVITQPEDELYRLLASLQRKEFLYEQPAFPEVEYIFKHALTQDVAYNSVLHERRKLLHEQVGQAIEQIYHDLLEEHFSELAHHYSRSGNAAKALEYLSLAGQQAAWQSAHEEAINYFTTALDLLKRLPETPERDQQELSLQIALGTPLVLAQGWSSPEVKQTYVRARELCQKGGETSQLFPVLWGLFNLHAMRGEMQEARDLIEHFLTLTQSVQDSSLLSRIHQVLGVWSFFQGDFVPARARLEQAIALYNFEEDHFYARYSGGIPAVVCPLYAALTLWLMGYPAQALKSVDEAVAHARNFSHPYSLAFTLIFSAILFKLRREERATREQAERAIAFCHEQGFPLFLTWGNALHGWALAEQGQTAKGIAQARQSLSAWRTLGGETWRPWLLSLLAEAYGKAKQPRAGLILLTEELREVHKTEEHWHEAELCRLKGELTLQQQSKVKGPKSKVEKSPESEVQSPESEAEECFLKAIEVSRRQQAKSLELRAVMSLVRLRQQQATQDASRSTYHETRARLNDAHQMLSEVYHWFTEGFDTKDLQEAKVLLEELT